MLHINPHIRPFPKESLIVGSENMAQLSISLYLREYIAMCSEPWLIFTSTRAMLKTEENSSKSTRMLKELSGYLKEY